MVACALIHHEINGATAPVAVKVKGGETLQIGFKKQGDVYSDVTLLGPADFVFEGKVEV
jgi:diaminopimelate epimerase